MNFLKNIIDKIFLIDLIQLKKYIVIFFGIILLLIFGIEILFFFQKKSIYVYQKKIIEQRIKINNLLSRKIIAEQNKQLIDKILNENPSFRIKEYLVNYLKKNNFMNNLSSDFDSIRESPSKPGYKEFSINLDLNNLTTKQLLSILTDIELDSKVLFREIVLKLEENEKKIFLSAILSTIKQTI